MDGQASDAPGTEGLAGLADFLSENDEQSNADEDLRADESNEGDLDNEGSADDQSGTDEEGDESQDDDADDEGEQDPNPATDRKFKVTVKGDDGEESTLEVGEKELIAGYQRQADYTRKTQELAQRETEAVEFLKGKHQEVVSHYLGQSEYLRAAVFQMAGIRSDEDMAQLAQSDPQAWVAEQQRMQSVRSFLSQLDQQIEGEKKRLAEEQETSRRQKAQQMFQRTWQELGKAKIDKPALGKIFGAVSKDYGFTPQELGNVYDHRIVLMMRDAAAYRALQSQKQTVQKKVEAAPRLPSKNAAVAQSRPQRERDSRFKTGRASLRDLAAIL